MPLTSETAEELDRLLDQKIDSIWHGRSKDSSNVPYSYIA